MSKRKPESKTLTVELEKLKAQIAPQIPDGLSDTAKALFLKAASKITFAPTETSGLSVSYENLNKEELFAIGISGSDAWPLFMPEGAKKILRAMQPRRDSGTFPATHPDLVGAQMRVRETLRKQVLINSHGEKFKPARPKGSVSNKTKYIHKLAIDNPNEKALALFLIADKEIIGSMSEGTFANHVSDARNATL